MTLPTIRETSADVIQETQLDDREDNGQIQIPSGNHAEQSDGPGESEGAQSLVRTQTGRPEHATNHDELLTLEILRPVSAGTDIQAQYPFLPAPLAKGSGAMQPENQLQESSLTEVGPIQAQLNVNGSLHESLAIDHIQVTQPMFPASTSLIEVDRQHLRAEPTLPMEHALGLKLDGMAKNMKCNSTKRHVQSQSQPMGDNGETMSTAASQRSHSNEATPSDRRACLIIAYEPSWESKTTLQGGTGAAKGQYPNKDCSSLGILGTQKVETPDYQRSAEPFPISICDEKSRKRRSRESESEVRPKTGKQFSTKSNSNSQVLHDGIKEALRSATPSVGDAYSHGNRDDTHTPRGEQHHGAEKTSNYHDNTTIRSHQIEQEDKTSATVNRPKQGGNQRRSSPQTRRQALIRKPTVTEVFTVLGDTITGNIDAAFDKITRNHHKDLEAYRTELFSLKETNAIMVIQLEAARQEKQKLCITEHENTLKLKSFAERVTRLQKFVNGLNNDIQRERAANKELTERISALTLDTGTLSENLKQALSHSSSAIDSMTHLRNKTMKELYEAERYHRQLEADKATLVEQLGEKKKCLEELVIDRDRLKVKLELRNEDSSRLEGLVDNNHGLVLSKLSEMLDTLNCVKDYANRNDTADMARTVHVIQERIVGSLTSMENIKQAILCLETVILAELHDMKGTKTVNGDESSIEGVRKFMTEHLNQMRAEMLGLQELQNQMTALREEKAAIVERLEAQGAQLAESTKQLESSKQAEIALREQNIHLSQQLQNKDQDETTSLEGSCIPGGKASSQEKDRTLGEHESSLQTEVEQMKAVLASKNEAINNLARDLERMARKSDESLNKLRIELARDADWAMKDEAAKYENKLRDLHIKHKKAEEALQAVQTRGRGSRRSAQQDSSKTKSGQNDADETLSALRSEHESTLAALRDDHDAAISRLHQEHEAAVADQSQKSTQELKSKVRSVRKELSDTHAREKQQLEEKLAEALDGQKTLACDLKKAKGEVEVTKIQLEATRRELEGIKDVIRKEAEAKVNQLKSIHATEQFALRQRLQKVEMELRTLKEPAASIPSYAPGGNKPAAQDSITDKRVESVDREEAIHGRIVRSEALGNDREEQENHLLLARHLNNQRQQSGEPDLQLRRHYIGTVVEEDPNKSIADNTRPVNTETTAGQLDQSYGLDQRIGRELPRANSSQRVTSSGSGRTYTFVSVNPLKPDRVNLPQVKTPHAISNRTGISPTEAPAPSSMPMLTQAPTSITTYDPHGTSQKTDTQTSVVPLSVANDLQDISHKRRGSAALNDDNVRKRSRAETKKKAKSTKRTPHQDQASPFQQHNNLHRSPSGQGQSTGEGEIGGSETEGLLSAALTEHQVSPMSSRLRFSKGDAKTNKASPVNARQAGKSSEEKADSEIHRAFDVTLRRSTRLNG